MTSISKYVYIDQLDDIVNKFNNTYYSKIKMKPFNVKSSTCIDFHKKKKKEYPIFKVGDHVGTSKNKNIIVEGNVPNWSEEVFEIKRIKNNIPWTCVISDLKGEEIVGTFYEKRLKTTNQT